VVVDSAALPPIIPPLATVRDLPTGYAHRDEPRPTGSGFGLYQGEKLAQQTQAAYAKALDGLLLPRLTYRLRDMLMEARETETLYSLLKLYLMVGGRGPLDENLFRQWAILDARQRYPGQRNEAMRAELDAHVAALMNGVPTVMPLDGALVERTRETLKRQPLAERAYALIQNSREAKALPDWSILDAAGPSAQRVFARRSGADLDEGVDGFYTYTGFHTVFLPMLVDVSREVAGESWVLGQNESLQDEQIRRLERDLAALYMDDYVATWDALLADIVLVPFETAGDATEVLSLLSGANSPLRNLLTEVANQTRLARTEAQGTGGIADLANFGGGSPGQQAEAVEAAAGQARQVTQALGLGSGTLSTVERLAGIFSDSGLAGGGGGASAASGGGTQDQTLPGQFVNDRFRRLHDYVLAMDGGSPPLDGLIDQLDRAYSELRRVSDSGGNLAALTAGGGGGGGGGAVDTIRRLETEAGQVPAPLSGWLTQIASGGQTVAVSSTRETLSGGWSAEILPFCREAIQGRYPFASGAGNEVALADFARLFAPNGMIDSFFRQNLLPYVDMSSKPWRSRRHNGLDLGLSRATLAQFERAAAIRDAFFPTGGSQLSVSFEVTPVALDNSANSVILEIDGQTVGYAHGPVSTQRLTWPGSTTRTRLSFQPDLPGSQSIQSFNGPWGFFRLLDQARRLQGGTGDRFRAVFTSGARSATFEIRAGSVTNPFNLPELRSFRCPGDL
jgi:type VI secretion system protein ImpL